MKSISFTRIKAVLYQEFFITLNSVEVIFDVFVFSFINLLLFGFLSLYLLGSKNSLAAQYLLSGIMLWEIFRIVQYSVSVGSLWNIWARNLSNMFIAPLTPLEYLSAHTFSGIIKALITFTLDSVIMIWVFHFNIYSLGMLNLFLLSINLMLFSFAIGIFLLGFIFRFGVRIQAFAWGLSPILQPLSACFFPISVLPPFLQHLAYLFPSTYIFEAGRFSLTTHQIYWQYIGVAFLLNVLYVVLATVLFSMMFAASKNSGQFARNES